MEDAGTLLDDAHRFGPAAPTEEYVYGSCIPGWHADIDDEAAVEEWLSFVRSRDVERVCCLLAGSSKELRNSALGRYDEAFGQANVRHVPTVDRHLLEREPLVDTILPFLVESVERESRVVVHCLSGIGRTGQVLAAWLVGWRDCSHETAVTTVREMGRDPLAAVERGNATTDELYDLLDSMPDLRL